MHANKRKDRISAIVARGMVLQSVEIKHLKSLCYVAGCDVWALALERSLQGDECRKKPSQSQVIVSVYYTLETEMETKYKRTQKWTE